MERMKNDILINMISLLKNHKLNIDYDTLSEFLIHYKSNDWLYPDTMRRSLKTDIKTIYEILELYADMKLLEPYLQIYCPHCQKYTGQDYKHIAELPDEFHCLHCDNEISNSLEHAIIIYRVS